MVQQLLGSRHVCSRNPAADTLRVPQYLRNVTIPIPWVGKLRFFELFPILLAIIVNWCAHAGLCMPGLAPLPLGVPSPAQHPLQAAWLADWQQPCAAEQAAQRLARLSQPGAAAAG